MPNKTYESAPIRIEYFEEAIEFLQQHERIDPARVGVFGLSKAGDLALSMMTYLEQVKAVCHVNASIATLVTPTTYKVNVTFCIYRFKWFIGLTFPIKKLYFQVENIDFLKMTPLGFQLILP